eukprot:scpid14791/ scgid1009/ 
MSSSMKKSGYLFFLKRGRYKLADRWETVFCELTRRSETDKAGTLMVCRDKSSLAIGLSCLAEVISQPLQNNRYLFALPRTDGCEPWMFGADTDTVRQQWIAVLRELLYSHIGIRLASDKALIRLTINATPYAKHKHVEGRQFAAIRDGYLRLYATDSVEQVCAVDLSMVDDIQQDGSGLTTVQFTDKSGKSAKQHKLVISGNDMTYIYTQISRASKHSTTATSRRNEEAKITQGSPIASPQAHAPHYCYFDELANEQKTTGPAAEMEKHQSSADSDKGFLPDQLSLHSNHSDSGVSGDESLHGNDDDNTTFRWWHSNARQREHSPYPPAVKDRTGKEDPEKQEQQADELERTAMEWLSCLPKVLRADHDSISKTGSLTSTQQDTRSTRSIDSITSGCVTKEDERSTPEEVLVRGTSHPAIPPLSAARLASLQRNGHTTLPVSRVTGPPTIPLPPVPATTARGTPASAAQLPTLLLARTPDRGEASAELNANDVSAPAPPSPGCPDIPKWSAARLRSYEEHKRSKLAQGETHTMVAQSSRSLDRHVTRGLHTPTMPPSLASQKHSCLQLTTSAPPPLPVRPASMNLSRRSSSVSALQPMPQRHPSAELRQRLASAPTAAVAACVPEHTYADLESQSSDGPDQVVLEDDEDPYHFKEAPPKAKLSKEKSRKSLSGVLHKLRSRSASLDVEQPSSPSKPLPSHPEFPRSISLSDERQQHGDQPTELRTPPPPNKQTQQRRSKSAFSLRIKRQSS